jgi:hypothetical protein
LLDALHAAHINGPKSQTSPDQGILLFAQVRRVRPSSPKERVVGEPKPVGDKRELVRKVELRKDLLLREGALVVAYESQYAQGRIEFVEVSSEVSD